MNRIRLARSKFHWESAGFRLHVCSLKSLSTSALATLSSSRKTVRSWGSRSYVFRWFFGCLRAQFRLYAHDIDWYGKVMNSNFLEYVFLRRCPLLMLYSASDRWLNKYGIFLQCCWQGKTEAFAEKPVPEPLCPPQIPNCLAWDWAQTYAVIAQRINGLATLQE